MVRRHRINRELCHQSMAKVRRILHAPEPEHVVWASLAKDHRIYLLMASGLKAERQVDPWEAFSAEEQAKITDQVKIGGDVARRWHRLRMKDVQV